MIDPVTFEVIRHRLWAINDEQAMIAARMSGSPVIYEVYDFNAGILTPDGHGLVAGIYILHHAATLDFFVKRILAEWPAEDIREGDMFFTNDPWYGALHSNDGVLVTPIFWEGEIVCWSGLAMHDEDVGSPVPGSFVVGARDSFGEAPLFPTVKMAGADAPGSSETCTNGGATLGWTTRAAWTQNPALPTANMSIDDWTRTRAQNLSVLVALAGTVTVRTAGTSDPGAAEKLDGVREALQPAGAGSVMTMGRPASETEPLLRKVNARSTDAPGMTVALASEGVTAKRWPWVTVMLMERVALAAGRLESTTAKLTNAP